MEEIKLNYRELAFIMNLDAKDMKSIYIDVLKEDKVSLKDEILVSDLIASFGVVKSNDSRYDGYNELLFALEHKSRNYKKYLAVKGNVKNKKFTGGKTIFYKICTEEQLNHAKECFEYYYKIMFKNKLE